MLLINDTAIIMVFLNIVDIVIIIDSCGKFQPTKMYFVEIHICVHNTYSIITNEHKFRKFIRPPGTTVPDGLMFCP